MTQSVPGTVGKTHPITRSRDHVVPAPVPPIAPVAQIAKIRHQTPVHPTPYFMDRQSQRLLQALETPDPTPDYDLIEQYIEKFAADPELCSTLSGIQSHLAPPLYSLIRLSKYDDIYVKLLLTILEPLNFADLVSWISYDGILEAVTSPSNELAYAAAHLVLSNLQRKDPDAFRFVESTEFFNILVGRALEDESAALKLVSEVERLAVILQLHGINSWYVLAEFRKSPRIQNTVLASRYLELIAIMCPSLSEEEFAKLGTFNMLRLIADDEEDDADPFYATMFVTFYINIVSKILFPWIRAPVTECIEALAEARSSHKQENYLRSELARLFQALSHSCSKFLLLMADNYPSLLQFDWYSEADVTIFKGLNLRFIRAKEFYSANFSSWDLDTVRASQNRVLLHLVLDSQFFSLLAANQNLDSGLQSLPADLSLAWALALSDHDYSATYMVENLPLFMLAFLKIDNSLVNSDLWELKKAALINLKFHRNVELGAWREGVNETLLAMLGGRRFDTPLVGVQDMAL